MRFGAIRGFRPWNVSPADKGRPLCRCVHREPRTNLSILTTCIFKKAKVRSMDSKALSADLDALAFFQSLHLLFIIYIEHTHPQHFEAYANAV